jgi:hypothetical protein
VVVANKEPTGRAMILKTSNMKILILEKDLSNQMTVVVVEKEQEHRYCLSWVMIVGPSTPSSADDGDDVVERIVVGGGDARSLYYIE